MSAAGNIQTEQAVPKQSVSRKNAEPKEARSGCQTLLRGLDILDAAADGPITLAKLAEQLGLGRSTAHRLGSALAERNYLKFEPRRGYSLGSKLMRLGFCAQHASDLTQVAHPHMERLAMLSGDAVYLCVPDLKRMLIQARVPGRRSVEVSWYAGERQPIIETGLGRALILNEPRQRWTEYFVAEVRQGRAHEHEMDSWLKTMDECRNRGYAFNMKDNREGVHAVAAPVFNMQGQTVASVGIASAAQYLDELHIAHQSREIRNTARAISSDLGWSGKAPR